MKKIIFLVFFGFIKLYSQVEGQSFCQGNENDTYFPLNIVEKKIYWANTFYTEKKMDNAYIGNKTYQKFEQRWENGNIDVLFLREENGIVYQYDEDSNSEFLRYDPKKMKWTSDEKGVYEILTREGTLKTPFCKYINLLVMEAKYSNNVFKFYYLKGYGYIGATYAGSLISYVSPYLNENRN